MSQQSKLTALCAILTLTTTLLAVATFGNFVGAQDAPAQPTQPAAPVTKAVSGENSKIAVLDFNKVMLADKLFDEAYRNFATQLRAEEQAFKEGIRKEIDDLNSQLRSRTIGTPEWRELNKKLSDAQMREIESITDIQANNRDDRDRVLKELVQRTDQVVAAVCRDFGYDTVIRKVDLDLNTVTGVQNYIQRAVVMYYTPAGRDITDEVIARLNQE